MGFDETTSLRASALYPEDIQSAVAFATGGDAPQFVVVPPPAATTGGRGGGGGGVSFLGAMEGSGHLGFRSTGNDDVFSNANNVGSNYGGGAWEDQDIEEEAKEAELLNALGKIPQQELEQVRKDYCAGEIDLNRARELLVNASRRLPMDVDLNLAILSAQTTFVSVLNEGFPYEAMDEGELRAGSPGSMSPVEARATGESSPSSYHGASREQPVLTEEDETNLALIHSQVGNLNHFFVMSVYVQCGRNVEKTIRVLQQQ